MRRFIAIIICFCSSFVLQAKNYQEIFFKANELYKEGKYQEAQALYEQIPDKSPKVYYNLGNCAYKLKHFGYALAYWRRAEKDWGLFNRAELLHNIALVKKQCKPSLDAKESPLEAIKEKVADFKGLIISVSRAMPFFLLRLLFLLMWAVSFLYLRYLYKKRQKAIIVLLFSANLFCGALLAIRYNFECREHGIIVVKNVDLLSGPGKNYQVLETLSETKQVLIRGFSHGFYKVKARGSIGWVEQKAIEVY